MKIDVAVIPASPLQHNHDLLWAVWAVTAAFGSYFCMYAFRKPFTAAGYADTTLWGPGFKTVLVTTEVVGYMISKFIGIRIVAEMLMSDNYTSRRVASVKNVTEWYSPMGCEWSCFWTEAGFT